MGKSKSMERSGQKGKNTDVGRNTENQFGHEKSTISLQEMIRIRTKMRDIEQVADR